MRMSSSQGFTSVQVQVTFVAALDNNGDVTQSWWSFAPDEADLKYTNATPPAQPDQISWKLNARNIDGSVLPGAVFAPTDGVRVQWTYAQPSRQGDPSLYAMPVTNLNTSGQPDGPYKFIATVQYKGRDYPSPDPDVVLEPRGT
jgi:hypothetical protein